jgi:hypothetical protein
MEDEEEEKRRSEYERLVCSICTNKHNCNRDCIKIHYFEKEITMRCPNYDYENKMLVI